MELSSEVEYAAESGIAWIRMRPRAGRRLVLMTTEILRALRTGVERASVDPDVAVIVLTGQGDSFMAGADLGFMTHASVAEFREFSRQNQALAAEIFSSEKSVIAGVNGHAIGGGLELALVCDLRVCVADARLGFPEVTIGLLHSTGSSSLLSRTIGLGRAKELVLTGRQLTAAEALDIGLVNEVVDRTDLDAVLEARASQIADNALPATAWAKRIFNTGSSPDFLASLAMEETGNLECYLTDERARRAAAFFDKMN